MDPLPSRNGTVLTFGSVRWFATIETNGLRFRFARRKMPSGNSQKQTIVIIEDDQDLCTLLEYNLSRSGYNVLTQHGIAGSLEAIQESRASLVILDVMLPDGDGFDFCRELRRNPSVDHVPILFLTARTQEIDRVLGLEIGGDDYITKPFSPRELVARVRAHLRRDRPEQSNQKAEEPLDTGGLKIDRESRRVSLDGSPLELTATEFSILEFFWSNPGRAYTREQLLDHVWGTAHNVTPRNVDVHIRRLRERLEAEPDNPKWIQTVRGYGYRFEFPK